VAGGVQIDYLKTLYLNLRRTQERGNNRLVAINSGTMSPTNRHGETPLHIACQHGEPLEVILKLLEDPSTAVKTQDQHGCLPLHYACMNGQNSFDVIEALIEAYPVGLGVLSSIFISVLPQEDILPLLKVREWSYQDSLGRDTISSRKFRHPFYLRLHVLHERSK